MAKDRAHDSRRVAKVKIAGEEHIFSKDQNGNTILTHANNSYTRNFGKESFAEAEQDAKDWHDKNG
jgi:hypothetical protein